MSKRIISGVIGAIFTVLLLFFNQHCLILLNVITASIAALAMQEIFLVMNTGKDPMVTIPSFLFVAVLAFCGSFGIVSQIVFYLYTLWMFSVMVIKPSASLKTVVLTYAMAVLISFSLGAIIELRNFGKQYGNFLVFLGLSIAWMSDTGAYFCGKFFGKNKLCPDVSPKKTVEGFAGGILTCVSCVMAAAAIFNNFIFDQKCHVNYFAIAVMALVGSPISALGDLCFSAIKRKCHVKDFGTIMPGHGGVLDRFDSVIFIVPYVYLFSKLVTLVF